VVECGSHSTRLLLSTGSSDILRLTQDTHLGDLATSSQQQAVGQQQQEQLPAAAAATLAVVCEYRQVLDQHEQQLAGITVLATAALREAAEGPAIAATIAKMLGCPAVRILSGGKQAHLLMDAQPNMSHCCSEVPWGTPVWFGRHQVALQCSAVDTHACRCRGGPSGVQGCHSKPHWQQQQQQLLGD
jgi:hypothetical protein